MGNHWKLYPSRTQGMEQILAGLQGHIVAVKLKDGRILYGVLLVGGMCNRLQDLDLGEVFEFDADEVERVED